MIIAHYCEALCKGRGADLNAMTSQRVRKLICGRGIVLSA